MSFFCPSLAVKEEVLTCFFDFFVALKAVWSVLSSSQNDGELVGDMDNGLTSVGVKLSRLLWFCSCHGGVVCP